MKWLLVNPTTDFWMPMFPTGLAYIASTLKQEGVEVSCLDLYHYPKEQHVQLLADRVLQEDIDVIATTGLSYAYSGIAQILNSARRIKPKITTVLGGGLLSSAPDLLSVDLNLAIGVIGEGEETIIEVARALEEGKPLHGIEGLIVRERNGNGYRTPERRVKNDINLISWPDWEGFELAKYLEAQHPGIFLLASTDTPRWAPINASRSCPFRCTFCHHAVKRYRQRSIESILEEIDHLVRTYQINGVFIYDDLFTLNHKRVEAFCKGIKPYGLQWFCQDRVVTAERGLVRMMRDAGCFCTGYGLESMNKGVLDSLRKRTSPPQVEAAIRIGYETKVNVQGDFIFGDPAETCETINETMTWWARNREYQIELSDLWVFPGTKLFQDAVLEGTLFNPLGYIRAGCPRLNLTKIRDEVFFAFIEMLKLAQITVRIPAEVHSLEECGNVKGEPRYAFEVSCPHCGRRQMYRNMPGKDWRTACRSCRARFDLPFTHIRGRAPFSREATRLILEAQEIYHLGRFKESISLSEEAILRHNLKDHDGMLLIGTAALRLGDLHRAYHDLRSSLFHDHDSAAAHNNLGVYFMAIGEYGFALLHFAQALLLERDQPQACANLKLVRAKIGPQPAMIPFIREVRQPPIPVDELGICDPAIHASNDHPGGTLTTWPPIREHGFPVSI